MEIKVETEVKKIEKRLKLPRMVDKVFEEVSPTIEEMRDEAPDHLIYSSAVNQLMQEYSISAPEGSIIGHNTVCSGAGVNVPVVNVSYNLERATATTPEVFKQSTGHYPAINKTTATATVKVGEQSTLGRMGGILGWSTDRDLVAGALASFFHNFVETLVAIVKRAMTPFDGEWVLPNLVLPETREPKQFVPPASFEYSVWRPAARVTTQFAVATATPAKIKVVYWDRNKKDLAATDEIELEEGTSTVKVALRGPPLAIKSGYMNVEPIDAPKGLTVSKVTAKPGLGVV